MLSHAQDTSILSDAEINDKFPRVAALLSTELPHGSQVSDEKLWNKIAEAATGVVPEDYTIKKRRSTWHSQSSSRSSTARKSSSREKANFRTGTRR